MSLLAFTQTLLLAFATIYDLRLRRVYNPLLATLLLAGTLAALVDGPQWGPWNLALPTAALVAYRFKQIGGADAKTLLALLPMPGPWVPWFLLAAFLNAAALHATTKKPPLLVAIFVAYATVAAYFLGIVAP